MLCSHGGSLLREDRTCLRVVKRGAGIRLNPASPRVELGESRLDRTLQGINWRSVRRVLDRGAEAAPDPPPARWRRRDDKPGGSDPLPEDRTLLRVPDGSPGAPHAAP